MNVTDRGYYTTTYLDNVNNKRGRNHKKGVGSDEHQSTKYRDYRSDYSTLNQGSPSQSSSHHSTPLEPPPLPHNRSQVPSKFSTQLMRPISTFDQSVGSPTDQFLPISPESQLTDSTMHNDEIQLDPDELHETITPAQLNYLQKRHQPKRRSRKYDERSEYDRDPNKHFDLYYPRGHDRNQSFDSYYDSTVSDGTSSRYDNYYNREHHVRIPKDSGRLKPTPKFKQSPPKGFHGYYINQKKRYDDAEFYKPTNYTHKTFKDVFQDDEASGKYNPMEAVFDDPEKIKEQEDNQKLKKAFKTMQLKLGKDDYDNYDYYDNKNTNNNVTNEIFVTNDGSDDDSEYEKIHDIAGDGSDEAGVDAIYETANAKQKKKVNFKKLWKSKTKQIKKELGKDYLKSMEKQWDLEWEQKKRKEHERQKKAQEEEQLAEMAEMAGVADVADVESEMQIIEDEVTNDPIITEPDDDDVKSRIFYAGQNPDFHPVWNYLLSWLVYDQTNALPNKSSPPKSSPKKPSPTKSSPSKAVASIAPSEDVKTIVPNDVKTIVPSNRKSIQQPMTVKPKGKPTKGKKPTKIKVNREQLKNFNKNLSKMKNMWGLPASHLFNGETPNSPVLSKKAVTIGKNSGMTIDEPLPQSLFDFPIDENSQEFIIELDSDDDIEIDEELYYNPNTGQLEPEPPTSFSSMDHPPVMGSPNFLRVDSKPSSEVDSKSIKSSNFYIDTSNGATAIISNINALIKSIKIMKIIFAPIDVISENFPNLQTVVILVELGIFMWMLYELSLLIDAICMMVKAICAPMIAMGRFMNRIM